MTADNNRWVSIFNYLVTAPSFEEAMEIATSAEYVADLSGWSPKITPIFRSMGQARIDRVDFLGMIPFVGQGNAEQVFADYRHMYAASSLLHGTASSKARFRSYLESQFWYVANRVAPMGLSAPMELGDVPISLLEEAVLH